MLGLKKTTTYNVSALSSFQEITRGVKSDSKMRFVRRFVPSDVIGLKRIL